VVCIVGVDMAGLLSYFMGQKDGGSKTHSSLEYFYEGISTSLFHVARSWSAPVVMLIRELPTGSSAEKCDVEIYELTEADIESDTVSFYNPHRKAPILILPDGKTLTEVGAIFNYLLLKYDKKYSLHPDPEDMDAYLVYQELFHYALSTLSPLISTNIVARAIEAAEAGPRAGHKEAVERAIDEWQQIVGPKLELFLSKYNGNWMLGEKISPIDILLALPLVQAMEFGLLSDFPTLQEYVKLITRLPSYREAFEGVKAETREFKTAGLEEVLTEAAVKWMVEQKQGTR